MGINCSPSFGRGTFDRYRDLCRRVRVL